MDFYKQRKKLMQQYTHTQSLNIWHEASVAKSVLVI